MSGEEHCRSDTDYPFFGITRAQNHLELRDILGSYGLNMENTNFSSQIDVCINISEFGINGTSWLDES